MQFVAGSEIAIIHTKCVGHAVNSRLHTIRSVRIVNSPTIGWIEIHVEISLLAFWPFRAKLLCTLSNSQCPACIAVCSLCLADNCPMVSAIGTKFLARPSKGNAKFVHATFGCLGSSNFAHQPIFSSGIPQQSSPHVKYVFTIPSTVYSVRHASVIPPSLYAIHTLTSVTGRQSQIRCHSTLIIHYSIHDPATF